MSFGFSKIFIFVSPACFPVVSFFLWPCSLAVPVLAGCWFFMLFVVLCPGTPEGSTGSGSGF